MKKVFAPLTLFLLVAYALVIAARSLGLGFASGFGLPLFIALFTGVSLIAIAGDSYGAQRAFRAPRRRRRVLQREPIADPFHATWTYQTISS